MMNRKAARRARRIRRTVLTVALMALVAVISIGGTIAWLTDKTEKITNTFTVGDIEISLTETDNGLATGNTVASRSIQIVPGTDIDKNPTVTVEANSEACYLFVMVEEKNWPAKEKVAYTIDSAWTEVTNVTDLPANTKLYYCEVAKFDTATSKPVLTDNKVYVYNTLNETDMEAIEKAAPSLAFKAFAVQKDNVNDAETAWGYIDPTAKNFN